MVSIKQEKNKRLNQAQRAEALKEIHFPEWSIPWVWSRKSHDGYTTLPRTIPIAMQAVDAKTKGQPAGHVLFCLWARSPDGPMLTIESQAIFAAEAGFSGERAIDTWRKRMRHLLSLGFIETKKGPSGDYHYVLLVNPNLALEKLRRNRQLADVLYGRFIDRIHEIGASNELNDIKNAIDAFAKVEQAKTEPQP